MLAYLIRRIVFGAAVLIGTSIITFAIAFVVPADPAVAMAGAKADPQTLATIRTELGLDQPVRPVRALPRSRDSRRPRPLVYSARKRDYAYRRSLPRNCVAGRRSDGALLDSWNCDGRDRCRISRPRHRQ